MNDPVDRLLDERQAMDRGLPGSLMLSLFAHLMLMGGAFAVMLFSPHEPQLKVMPGFVELLPAGGLGRPNAEPPAPAPSVAPEPAPSEAPPAPKVEPPKVITVIDKLKSAGVELVGFAYELPQEKARR